ncbi:MAG: signal peptidase I [Candidatus Paceibacterota bacterium]|jgi:signal peptidase
MDIKRIDIKKVKKISYWLIFGFLFTVLIFVLIPLLPIENNYSLKMVLSGSMSPAIKTGSIVAVKPALSYKIGDVITFKTGKTERDIVTHRIINQTEQGFIVQGDANNVADIRPVEERQIIGKVILTIPYAAYVINAVRSKIGLVLLIVIPALLIIGDEVRKIFQEAQKIQQKKTEV